MGPTRFRELALGANQCGGTGRLGRFLKHLKKNFIFFNKYKMVAFP